MEEGIHPIPDPEYKRRKPIHISEQAKKDWCEWVQQYEHFLIWGEYPSKKEQDNDNIPRR